jgi:type IV pilus assembly protein PilM
MDEEEKSDLPKLAATRSSGRFGGWFRPFARKAAIMPIGVDFAAESLHLVQCERDGKGVSIRAAVSVRYPGERALLLADEKALRKFVRAALARAPFSDRRVYSTLAPGEVRIVPLTVQCSGAQVQPAAVIKALREKLRSDLSKEVVDYQQIRGGAVGSELNVLAAVAPRETVLAHLHRLEAAGMEPVAIDIAPSALARLLTAMHPDHREHSVLLVDFGAQRSSITVVSGRRLILDREVEFGEAKLVAKLAAALSVDAAAASAMLEKHAAPNPEQGGSPGRAINEILHREFAVLEEEIAHTLVYIASKTHGGTAKCIYLNGGISHHAYIHAKVQRMVDIPVELLNPFACLAASRPSAYSASSVAANGIALATGLALRG